MGSYQGILFEEYFPEHLQEMFYRGHLYILELLHYRNCYDQTPYDVAVERVRQQDDADLKERSRLCVELLYKLGQCRSIDEFVRVIDE